MLRLGGGLKPLESRRREYIERESQSVCIRIGREGAGSVYVLEERRFMVVERGK